MIRKFYLFENTIYSYLRKNNSEEDIQKVIGIDPKNYELDISGGNIILSFKEDFLTKFLELESGVFHFIFNILSNYSGAYEYPVEYNELNYIYSDLTKENKHKLRMVLKYFDIDYNIVENEMLEYFFHLLGNLIDMNGVIYEISQAISEVIRKDVKNFLNELPIEIEQTYGKYDVDIIIDIEKMGEYIEKEKLEDINTIADYLKNINLYNLDYELDNYYESEYEVDYTEMNKEFSNEIDSLIEKLDIFEEENIEDPNQLKLFDYDEKIKYKFDFDIFSKIPFDSRNVLYAKEIGGKIIAWFRSYIFQKDYMKNPTLEKYNTLKTEKIINPKIKDEYEYLDSANMFNI